MKHQHSRVNARKGGFTLVEIIVVLVIATILSSILFTAFKSVSEGNKKTTCQSNLVQIYQALRLYGQDFNGELPSYNPHKVGQPMEDEVDGRASSGLGLWSLYAYPSSDKLDCDGRTIQLPATEAPNVQTPPLASYIKSPRFFHCPYDDFDRTVVRPVAASDGCRVPSTTTMLNSSQLELKDKDGISYFNPFYNSYQTADDEPASGSVRDRAPYSSFRTSKASRQLVYWESASPNNLINPERRTPDTTVVTWCRFHRKMNSAGVTVEKASNSDNVLFMDGTVRYLPTTQLIGTAECKAWQRIPEEAVEGYNSANPNTCPQ